MGAEWTHRTVHWKGATGAWRGEKQLRLGSLHGKEIPIPLGFENCRGQISVLTIHGA